MAEQEKTFKQMSKMMVLMINMVMMLYMFQMISKVLGKVTEAAGGAAGGAAPPTTGVLLEDNFDDNSLDTNIWEIWTGPTAGSYSETNGKANFNVTTSDAQVALQTKSAYAIAKGGYVEADVDLGTARTVHITVLTNKITSGQSAAAGKPGYQLFLLKDDSTTKVNKISAVDTAWTAAYSKAWAGTALKLKIEFTADGKVKFYEAGNLIYEETSVITANNVYVLVGGAGGATAVCTSYADNVKIYKY